MKTVQIKGSKTYVFEITNNTKKQFTHVRIWFLRRGFKLSDEMISSGWLNLEAFRIFNSPKINIKKFTNVQS